MAVPVPERCKVKPEAITNPRCPECDGPLIPHGKILLCKECANQYEWKSGHYYPRKCAECGRLFVTRHFHQFYCCRTY